MHDRDAAAWQRRALGHAERGELSAAEAEIGPAAATPEGARWRAALALVTGRLATCEGILRDSMAALPPGVSGPEVVVLAALRREQGRPAEAETVLRVALDGDPTAPAGTQAFAALLVAEMGRDTVARAELDRLVGLDVGGPDLTTTALCAEVASVVGLFAEADSLHRVLWPHRDDFLVDPPTGLCHGSLHRHLGRLCHVLGRYREAVAHFDRALDDHTRAGAPLLVAHTSRQLAAVLRVWGEDAEWDRSLDLLRTAAAVYRRLGVESAAADAQAVLARSDDLDLPLDWSARRGVFRRDGDRWSIGIDGAARAVPAVPGFDDLAHLLAVPRTALHVADLLAGVVAPDPRARTDRPWFWPRQPRTIDDEALGALVDASAGAAYEHRLAALPAEVAAAEAAGDRVGAAVARGEHDVLQAELAELRAGDPTGPRPTALERARRVVATRIRLAVDRVEEVDAAAGRHLRNAVRTGTFCSYEPQRDLTWLL